MECLLGSIVN
uniref:Uncharacterized protein n=1 Tax=Arundo donax TaxID=35708 RepID=A0A0A8YVF6_ARUDO